jgi:hypothetical protein
MKTRTEDERRRYSRRGFLKRAGAGAGAVALSGTAPRAAAARSGTVETRPTTFGRMFRNLRPFAAATDEVKEALADLGKPGGLLDAADDLGKGPIALITDLSLSANNRNNRRTPRARRSSGSSSTTTSRSTPARRWACPPTRPTR